MEPEQRNLELEELYSNADSLAERIGPFAYAQLEQSGGVQKSLNVMHLSSKYGVDPQVANENYEAISKKFGYTGNPEADFSKIQSSYFMAKTARENAEALKRAQQTEESKGAYVRHKESVLKAVEGIPVAEQWAKIGFWGEDFLRTIGSNLAEGGKSFAFGAARVIAASGKGSISPGYQWNIYTKKELEREQEQKKTALRSISSVEKSADQWLDDFLSNVKADEGFRESFMGQVAGSIGQSIPATAAFIANPLAGATVAFSQQFNESFNVYMEEVANADPNDAAFFGGIVAAPSAALESLGIERAFGTIFSNLSSATRRNILKEIVRSIPAEVTTEVLQKGIENLMLNEFDVRDTELTEGFWDTIKITTAQTAITGGFLGSVASVVKGPDGSVNGPEDYAMLNERFRDRLEPMLMQHEVLGPIAMKALDGDVDAQQALASIVETEPTIQEIESQDLSDLSDEVLQLEQGIEGVDFTVEDERRGTQLPEEFEVSPVEIRPGDPRDKKDLSASLPRARQNEVEKLQSKIEKYEQKVNDVSLKYQTRISDIQSNWKAKLDRVREQSEERRVRDKQKYIDERADLTDAFRQLQSLVDTLPRNIRGDFRLGSILNVKTTDGKLAYLAKAEQRIMKLFDKEQRRIGRIKVRNEVKRGTKGTQRQQVKRVGNEASLLLNEAKRILSRTPQENTIAYDSAIEAAKTENEQNIVKNLYYLLNDIQSANTKRLNDAVALLSDIRKNGSDAMQAKRASEKNRIEGLRNATVSEILGSAPQLEEAEIKESEEKRSKWGKISDYVRDTFVDTQSGLEVLLDNIRSTGSRFQGYLQDNFVTPAFKATQEFHSKQRETMQGMGDFLFEQFKINGKTRREGWKLLADFDKKQRGHGIVYKQNAKQKNATEVPLSQWEAVSLWMYWQDKTQAPSFETMEFTEQTLKKVEAFIGPEGIASAKKMLEEYRRLGEATNEALYEVEGWRLPLIKNYSPVFKRGSTDDLSLDKAMDMNDWIKASEKDRSHKERTKSNSPLVPKPAHRIFERHSTNANHYTSFARVAKDLRNTFSDPDVKRAIRQINGANAVRLIENQIDDVIRGTINPAKSEPMIQKLISNLAVSKLALNLPSAIKQLGSIPAYADVMPAGEWAKGIADFFKNPVENARLLLDTQYMKNRLSNSYDRDLRALSRKDIAGKFAGLRSWRDRIMFMTRFGDAGAIVAGGWPVYSYTKQQAIDAGLSEAEATQKAELAFAQATDRAQQSAEIMSLGYWQRGGGLAKLFTMYMTSPIQYSRVTFNAIKAAKRGRISKKEAAKTVLVYHVVLPQIFTAMGSLGIGAFSDDDDKREKFWRRQYSALLVGNLQSLFMIGPAWEAAMKTLATDEATFDRELSVPLFKQLEDFVKAADAIEEEEYVKGADNLASLVFSFAGLPYDVIVKELKNVTDVLGGEAEHPVMRLMGYSDYMLLEDDYNKKRRKRKRSSELLDF